MNIYITETEILVADCPPENSARISTYSKNKLLETIKEFPDLSHPLPIYKFLYWTGEVYTVVDLASFSKQHNLNQTILKRIHTYSGSHKGLIKCPDKATKDREHNKVLYNNILEKLKPSNKFFSRSPS